MKKATMALAAGLLAAGMVALASAQDGDRFWVIGEARYTDFSEAEIDACKGQWREVMAALAARGHMQAVNFKEGWFIKPRSGTLLIKPHLFKDGARYHAHLDLISLETSELIQRVTLEDKDQPELFKKIRDWVLEEDPVFDVTQRMLKKRNLRTLGIILHFREQGLDPEYDRKVEKAVRDMITFIANDNRMLLSIKQAIAEIGAVQRVCASGRFKGEIKPNHLLLGRYVLSISVERSEPGNRHTLKFHFAHADTGEQKAVLTFNAERHLSPTKMAGSIYQILNIRR